MRFKNYLNEKSFTDMDIPKYFRVIFDFGYALDKNIGRQLGNGKLDGLTGITDKKEMIFSWLGVGRDAMLIMNGQEVIKQNSITKIMYNNPHYLLDNNMSALKRIWNKSNEKDNRGTFHNLGDYLSRELGKWGKIDQYDLKAQAPGQRMAGLPMSKTFKVNNIKQLKEWFVRAAKEVIEDEPYYYRFLDVILELDAIDLNMLVMDTLRGIGETYKDEGEWIIKDKQLKVPKGSTIFILNPIPKEHFNDYKNGNISDFLKIYMDMHKSMFRDYELIMSTIKKYNLERKYKIVLLDQGNFNTVKKKYLDKRYG